MLEGYSASKLAPKLLGMVDDKKNIERRIRMIKMAEVFKSKRRLVFTVGLICLVTLGGVLLTSGLTKNSSSASPNTYNADTLFKYKTAYVGDNSKVANLINNLPYASSRREISLQTQTAPYGITVNYDLNNEAVSHAIKARSASYGAGETATEGHIILDTEEGDGTVRVYTVASFGAFGFENGIFTKVSGSGSIPTVMTFSKNKDGEYSLLDYKEPMDGAHFTESTKSMFPKGLWEKVLSSNSYPILVKQQEKQAAEYLQSIGRNAQVSASNVEKRRVEINVEASNKLFAEFTKYNPFLNNCPYWIGTREQIENGVRYIYETSQSKTGDGYDLIVFIKTKEDGTIVEEHQYKIVGNQPQLLREVGR